MSPKIWKTRGSAETFIDDIWMMMIFIDNQTRELMLYCRSYSHPWLLYFVPITIRGHVHRIFM